MAARAANAPTACLNEAEVRDAVLSRIVIPQIQALRVARAETGGEAVGASLCHVNDALVYIIMTLTRDGKLRRVFVHGVTGKTIEGDK